MLKNTLLALATLTLGATLALADGGHGGGTPPTAAQTVAARVARLTVQLTLTTAQQTTATTIFTTEQTALTALDTSEATAQTALLAAIKANSSTGIATQAAALGDIEKQEVLASATAEASFYASLTTAQQTIYDNMRLGGLAGPGGH